MKPGRFRVGSGQTRSIYFLEFAWNEIKTWAQIYHCCSYHFNFRLFPVKFGHFLWGTNFEQGGTQMMHNRKYRLLITQAHLFPLLCAMPPLDPKSGTPPDSEVTHVPFCSSVTKVCLQGSTRRKWRQLKNSWNGTMNDCSAILCGKSSNGNGHHKIYRYIRCRSPCRCWCRS